MSSPKASLAEFLNKFLEEQIQYLVFQFHAKTGSIEAIHPEHLVAKAIQFAPANLYELIPLLLSLQDTLLTQRKTISIPNVNLPIAQLSAIEVANLHILPYGRSKYGYVCLVENLSHHAKWLQDMQQSAHDSSIYNELLLANEKILKLEKENLELRNRELEQMQAFKNRLYAAIAHELRNPTQGIIGLAELIQEEPLSAKQTEYIKSIYRAALHMQTLLNDFLDYSKLEAGEISLVQQPFSIQDILNHLELSLLKATQEKGLFLRIYVSASIPPVIIGDSARLLQILYNLAGNAIKFTEKGGISIEAYLDAIDAERCRVRLEIKDTGIGIPPEKLQTIFEPYKQAHDDTSLRFGGTGLGLSIVKELVERMGGSIEVQSKVERGSTFIVLLPFKMAEISANLLEEDLSPVPEDFHGVRTLLAEDNPAISLYLQKILEKRGIHVDVATSAAQASKLLEKNTYQLLLCDWHLSDGTAEPLLKELFAQQQDQPRPAVVLISASEKVNEHGLAFDAIIPKHFNESQFFHSLSPILKRIRPFPRLISFDHLLEYTQHDEELLLSILNSIIPELERQNEALKKAYAGKLMRKIGEIVHQVKPIAQILGYEEFVYHVEKVNFILNNQLNPHLRLKPHIKKIQEIIPEVIAELKHYQKQLKDMLSL
jgi:signal transduction histidine kinase/CheY-like chemotaxis protein